MRIEISGMHCKHCVKRVENALKDNLTSQKWGYSF